MRLSVDVGEERHGEWMALVVVGSLALAEDPSVGSHEVILPVLVDDRIGGDIGTLFGWYALLFVHRLALIIDGKKIFQVIILTTEILLLLVCCQRVEALVAGLHLLSPHLDDTAKAKV